MAVSIILYTRSGLHLYLVIKYRTCFLTFEIMLHGGFNPFFAFSSTVLVVVNDGPNGLFCRLDDISSISIKKYFYTIIV